MLTECHALEHPNDAYDDHSISRAKEHLVLSLNTEK
jgi:hypothetical protein